MFILFLKKSAIQLIYEVYYKVTLVNIRWDWARKDKLPGMVAMARNRLGFA